MTQACRNKIRELWRDNTAPEGAHAGLLLDRYLLVPVGDKSDSDPHKKHSDVRRQLHHAFFNVYRGLSLYTSAFERYRKAFENVQASGNFRTRGRMIIGLGGENVLETGISLHHTYGTPVIPGSALKGLAWHYCHQVWGSQESKFKEGGEYHTAIFGTTEDAGHFTFHDGLILPNTLTSSIRPDVMTPHHGEYYQNKDFPTDFDDPNPITFLSVTGTFFIAVTCDIQDETGKEWEKLVFDLLSEALSTWGIGGKTSSGYGRLELVSSSDKKTVPGKVPVTGQGNPLSPQQAHAHTPQAEINPYRSGMTVRVTRCEDIIRTKRGHKTTQKIYQAEDGQFGIIEYGDSAIVGVGESTELIVVRYDAGDKKYFFAVSGTWVQR